MDDFFTRHLNNDEKASVKCTGGCEKLWKPSLLTELDGHKLCMDCLKFWEVQPRPLPSILG